ncbi:MAG: cell division protein SepF [Actinobacteria bacterium]|nr:cell division protein SepF [Actinomycetota bacterium]
MTPLGSVGPWSADDEYEERAPARRMHEAPPDEARGSPRRMCVVEVGSFDKGAQAVADQFKRRRPVLLNLQRVDRDLSERMVDFCAGLVYALDGAMHPVVDRLFLLAPNEVEVSSKESPRDTRKAFFNRL